MSYPESISTPLTPPAFDVLQRVSTKTSVALAGYAGTATVCELVPTCDPGGHFLHWLYRIAWDNEFSGPALTSNQLTDAQWLSEHCTVQRNSPLVIYHFCQ